MEEVELSVDGIESEEDGGGLSEDWVEGEEGRRTEIEREGFVNCL